MFFCDKDALAPRDLKKKYKPSSTTQGFKNLISRSSSVDFGKIMRESLTSPTFGQSMRENGPPELVPKKHKKQ